GAGHRAWIVRADQNRIERQESARSVRVQADLLVDGRTRRPNLNASGPAETDRHLVAFDNHRHGAATFTVSQHPLELRRPLLDIDVGDRNPAFLVVSARRLCVRAAVLPENRDHRSIVPGRTGVGPGSDPQIGWGPTLKLAQWRA